MKKTTLLLIVMNVVLLVTSSFLAVKLSRCGEQKPAVPGMDIPQPALSLVSNIYCPDTVNTKDVFEVVMTVSNNGREKLLNVIPSSLTPKGSAKVEMIALPEPVPAVLDPKKGFVFRWKYKADYIGTLRFRGNAIAEDVKEQAIDSLSTFSNVLTVFEP